MDNDSYEKLRHALKTNNMEAFRRLLQDNDYDPGQLLTGPVGETFAVRPRRPFNPDAIDLVIKHGPVGPERMLHSFLQHHLYGQTKKALNDAYLYGDDPMPTRNKHGGNSQSHLQFLSNGFAKRLDALLKHIDDPVAVLDEYDLLSAPDSWGPDPPDELPRFDTLIVAVILRTEQPTNRLQMLVDDLIEKGYELSDDESERYQQQFDSPAN